MIHVRLEHEPEVTQEVCPSFLFILILCPSILDERDYYCHRISFNVDQCAESDPQGFAIGIHIRNRPPRTLYLTAMTSQLSGTFTLLSL